MCMLTYLPDICFPIRFGHPIFGFNFYFFIYFTQKYFLYILQIHVEIFKLQNYKTNDCKFLELATSLIEYHQQGIFNERAVINLVASVLTFTTTTKKSTIILS